jgi:hypothetical protein
MTDEINGNDDDRQTKAMVLTMTDENNVNDDDKCEQW